MPNRITYEQPLNERVRSFLRLEFLFTQAAHFIGGDASWDSHCALHSILEVQRLLGRNDLKTEVLKELERQTGNLARLEQNPQVDRERLTEILGELEMLTEKLYGHTQPMGSELRENEFLNAIRQRASIPGGTCSFDLPAYHHWLIGPRDARKKDLQQWLDSYATLQKSIEVLLKLVRESAPPVQQIAENGFFQRALDSANPCQLLRVSLAPDCDLFPEISGGRHRFTIRFLQQSSPNEKPVQTEQDLEFELMCCMI